MDPTPLPLGARLAVLLKIKDAFLEEFEQVPEEDLVIRPVSESQKLPKTCIKNIQNPFKSKKTKVIVIPALIRRIHPWSPFISLNTF